MKELSEIKRVATGHLHLLGFKPLSCLRDYYNLKPSTFLYPSDEVTVLLVINKLLITSFIHQYFLVLIATSLLGVDVLSFTFDIV